MLHRILGGIYLSSYEPFRAEVDLGAYGITHIVSVLPGSIPDAYVAQCKCLLVPVMDVDSENILQYFPQSNAFIDSALFPEGNTNCKHATAVLVHCQEGVSRSATIVVAYLMHHYKLSLKQALHAVKRRNAAAEPNRGFLRQLELYSEMGNCVDTSLEEYRRFVVDLNLQRDPSGRSLMAEYVEKDKENATSDGEDGKEGSPLAQSPQSSSSQLRCKRCRQVLAISTQIDTHEPPESDSRQAQFVKTAPHSRRIINAKPAAPSCSHYFLKEPLNWMKDELQGKGELDGKFACPKCSGKVGGYSWKGSRCSCGRWMVPALHLQTAKVDFVRLRGVFGETAKVEGDTKGGNE